MERTLMFNELDEQQLNDVHGGGVLGGIVGGAIGFLVGIPVGMTAYTVGRLTGSASTDDFGAVMKDSMLASAGVGMMLGTFTPTP